MNIIKRNSVENRAYKFEENKFPEIYVDINYKCNMACLMCYSETPFGGKGAPPDLDLDYFEEFCAKLPRTIIIPMVGGEPTISKNIFKYLEIAHKYGHMPFVATNGRRFAQSLDFTKEFAKVARGGRTRIHIDFSCGYNEEYSQIIFGESVIKMKIQALDNMVKAKLGKVLISSSLIRGFNEDVIPDILDIVNKYKKIVHNIKFRAQGHIGRFIENEDNPYTTPEILKLLEKHIGEEAIYKNIILSGEHSINVATKNMDYQKKYYGYSFPSGKPCALCLGKNCCMHFSPSRGLQIFVLDNFTQQGTCWRKGFLTNEGTIIPWSGPYAL